MNGDRAAPSLLVAFFAATLAMVIAVVVLLRGTGHWVDFAMIGLLFVVASGLFIVQMRQLAQEEAPDEDDDVR